MTRLLFILTMGVLLSACTNPTSSASGSSSSLAVNNAAFYISGNIYPTTFPVTSNQLTNPSTATSATYNAFITVASDSNNTVGSALSDASVTINGQPVPWHAANNDYDVTLNGTFGPGTTFNVVVTHANMATVTQTLTVPTTVVPQAYTWTTKPTLNGSVSPTTITPNSAWSHFGCLAALLYDAAKDGDGVFSYWYETSLNGTSGYSFTSANLLLESGASATNVRYTSWSEDKFDLSGYGSNGTSPSRLRVYAPDGFIIGGTF